MVAVVAGGALLLNMLAGSPDDATESAAAADERGYYLNDARLTELGADGRPRVVVRASRSSSSSPTRACTWHRSNSTTPRRSRASGA